MIPRPLRRALETLTHPHSLDDFGAAFRRSWTSEPIGTVTRVDRLTPRSVGITMRTNASWPGHVAGQWVPVSIEVDGRRHTRTYSITGPSSRPGRTEISFAVQRVPGGIVSNAICDSVTVGDTIFLGHPRGEFTLPDHDPTIPLLLIGGGSGMTPIRGLLAELVERRTTTGAAPDVVVVSYAPSESERLFGADLDRLDSTHPWITVHRVDLDRDVTDPAKRLGPALLDRLVPDWRDRRAYACGPASLLDDAEATYDAAGRRARLVVERFTRVLPPADGRAAAGSVTVSLEGAAATLTLPTDVPLLDTIEAAGQLAPSGCRNGICHTCSVELLDGCAVNLRDGRVSEAGTHVQLCINAPLTDLSLAL